MSCLYDLYRMQYDFVVFHAVLLCSITPKDFSCAKSTPELIKTKESHLLKSVEGKSAEEVWKAITHRMADFPVAPSFSALDVAQVEELSSICWFRVLPEC